MIFNWLMNHVFDRQGYRDFLDECRRLDDNARMLKAMEVRIKETFTPDEWEATRDLCEAQLRQFNTVKSRSGHMRDGPLCAK